MYLLWQIAVCAFAITSTGIHGRGITYPNSLWIVPNTIDNVLKGGKLSDAYSDSNQRFLARANLLTKGTWPDGKVYYAIDNTYMDFEIDLIRHSMDEIEANTCVKFIKRTDELNYILIRNLHDCSAHIGFRGERQSVILSTKRCMKKGIIIHELMHALGFIHEHSRPNRDEYIRLYTDNIKEEYKYNFDKYEPEEVNDFQEPYDYDSIMHYDRYSYAIDRSKPVLDALKPNGNLDVREILSPADIRKLNKLYTCQQSK